MVNSGAPEGYTVPVSHVASVVYLQEAILMFVPIDNFIVDI